MSGWIASVTFNFSNPWVDEPQSIHTRCDSSLENVRFGIVGSALEYLAQVWNPLEAIPDTNSLTDGTLLFHLRRFYSNPKGLAQDKFEV